MGGLRDVGVARLRVLETGAQLFTRVTAVLPCAAIWSREVQQAKENVWLRVISGAGHAFDSVGVLIPVPGASPLNSLWGSVASPFSVKLLSPV